MIVVGASMEPRPLHTVAMLGTRLAVRGWPSGTSLNVFGTVSASGNVYLQTPGGTGIDFGSSSTVVAGGLASFLWYQAVAANVGRARA